ncbi:MAG: universal stress protein [Halovenus sp.]
MYDEILLPTDGSVGMAEVTDHAINLAEVHDARIKGLYVVDTASLSDIPFEASWEGVIGTMEREGRTALNEIERRAGDVPVGTEILEGSPAREIVNYAVEEGCDVILMGTHGRSGVDRLLLGSVAERVVRRSSVPVMTLRVGLPEQ